MPSRRAAKYIPVPPHRIGNRPAARAASIASSAAPRHQATLPASAAGRTPYSTCGAMASSAGLGRAVTTRNSR